MQAGFLKGQNFISYRDVPERAVQPLCNRWAGDSGHLEQFSIVDLTPSVLDCEFPDAAARCLGCAKNALISQLGGDPSDVVLPREK
jgi:hypothetical protein